MNIKTWYCAFLISYIIFGFSKSASAETDAFLGSQWLVIGDDIRVEVKKDSITREGNFVESEFAYFYSDWEDPNLFMSVKGKRRDNCNSYQYSIDSVSVLSATLYNQNYEGTEVEEVALSPDDDMFYYVLRPLHSKMLHRFLCNNIILSDFLKPGMNVIDAVNRLKNIGYRVIEIFEGAAVSHHDPRICDSNQPCITCGNGWSGCYISLENKQSGLTINLQAGKDTLIDAEYFYKK